MSGERKEARESCPPPRHPLPTCTNRKGACHHLPQVPRER